MTPEERLVVANITGWQDLEDTIAACIVGRTIDNAVGSQLDVLGKLVGSSRPSDDDEIYRRYIRVQIAVNRSQGRTSDIIKVTRLALGPTFDAPASRIVVDTTGIACFVLRIEDETVDDDLAALVFRFVNLARAAGVCFTLEYGSGPSEDWARFDVDTFDGTAVMIGAI